MVRLELPDGAWAEVRDPRSVSERLRRPVSRAAADLAALGFDANLPPSGEQIDALGRLNDVAVVALVAAWSFEGPVTADSVLDLPGDAYGVLVRHAASKVVELMPDFGPNPDPVSPTAP